MNLLNFKTKVLNDVGEFAQFWQMWMSDLRKTVNPLQIQNTGVQILSGFGSPETIVTANPGSLFLRADGGAGTSLYVKEAGTGNVGWVGK